MEFRPDLHRPMQFVAFAYVSHFIFQTILRICFHSISKQPLRSLLQRSLRVKTFMPFDPVGTNFSADSHYKIINNLQYVKNKTLCLSFCKNKCSLYSAPGQNTARQYCATKLD